MNFILEYILTNNILPSVIVSIIVSFITGYFSYKFNFKLSKSKVKTEILNNLPQISIGETPVKNNTSIKCYYGVINSRKNNGELFLEIHENKPENISYTKYLKINNHTSFGMEINSYLTSTGENIDISNWNCSEIDGQSKEILFLSSRDMPAKMLCTYRDLKIIYHVFKKRKGYIYGEEFKGSF